MNIKQAKDDIENTVRLYLKKDEFGEYRIPVIRQRPIFLLGAPGIGKTAIMEQVAQEVFGFLFHDPSYQTVGPGASLYFPQGISGHDL